MFLKLKRLLQELQTSTPESSSTYEDHSFDSNHYYNDQNAHINDIQSSQVQVSEAQTSKTTDQLWNLLQNDNSRGSRGSAREIMNQERSETQNEPRGFHFGRRNILIDSNQEPQYNHRNHGQTSFQFQGQDRDRGNQQGQQNQVSQSQSPQQYQQQSIHNQEPIQALGLHFMPPSTHHTWFPGDQAGIFQSSLFQRTRKFSQSQEVKGNTSSPRSRPTEGHFSENNQSSEERNSARFVNTNKNVPSEGHGDSDSGFHFGASSGFSLYTVGLMANRPRMTTIATQTEPVHCIPLRPSSINSVPVSQQQINQSVDHRVTQQNHRIRHYSHETVFENLKNRPTEMISLLSPSPQYHHQQSNGQQPQMSPLSPCHPVPSPSSNHCQPKFVFESVDPRSPSCAGHSSEPQSPPNKLRILLENGHHFAKTRVIQQPVESSVQYDPPSMRKFSGWCEIQLWVSFFTLP